MNKIKSISNINIIKNNNQQIKKQIVALIPAAGIGSRMHLKYPKQYLTIAGKTLLEYSLSALLNQPRISKIIVLLNINDNMFAKLAIAKNPMIKTIIGGYKRSHSVLNGLNYLADNLLLDPYCWVLIHDAVRPCFHKSDLEKIINFIDKKKSSVSDGGILAKPVSDTIKRSLQYKKNINYTIERNGLWHALTPQFFQLRLIKDCLTKALSQKISVTDEASALEYCGYQPYLLRGLGYNLKVTNPEDFIFAKLYLSLFGF